MDRSNQGRTRGTIRKVGTAENFFNLSDSRRLNQCKLFVVPILKNRGVHDRRKEKIVETGECVGPCSIRSWVQQRWRERGKGLFGVYDKNCPLKRPNGPPPIALSSFLRVFSFFIVGDQ
jgi:hypothetical protein